MNHTSQLPRAFFRKARKQGLKAAFEATFEFLSTEIIYSQPYLKMRKYGHQLPRQFLRTLKKRGVRAAMGATRRYFRNELSRIKAENELRKYIRTIEKCQAEGIDLAVRRIHGSKMLLKMSDMGLSRQLLLEGTRERMQTKLVKELLRPGMTTLEIGANLGYYALMEASIIGKFGKVYAIEPVPETFEILERNVRLNRYQDRMDLHCCAISDRCGASRMTLTTASNCATMFFQHPEMSEVEDRKLMSYARGVIPVNTTTVDEFLKGKAPVDFIRMDLEGYEIVVVKGMTVTLQQSKSGTVVFMELHTTLFKRSRAAVEEILEVFRHAGFEVTHIVDSKGSRLLDFSPEMVMNTLFLETEWALGVFLQKVRTVGPKYLSRHCISDVENVRAAHREFQGVRAFDEA